MRVCIIARRDKTGTHTPPPHAPCRRCTRYRRSPARSRRSIGLLHANTSIPSPTAWTCSGIPARGSARNSTVHAASFCFPAVFGVFKLKVRGAGAGRGWGAGKGSERVETPTKRRQHLREVKSQRREVATKEAHKRRTSKSCREERKRTLSRTSYQPVHHIMQKKKLPCTTQYLKKKL